MPTAEKSEEMGEETKHKVLLFLAQPFSLGLQKEIAIHSKGSKGVNEKRSYTKPGLDRVEAWG